MIHTNAHEIEYTDLQKIAQSFCKSEPKIIFSIFDMIDSGTDNSWVVNAPDIQSNKPLYEGPHRFRLNYWRFGPTPHISEVYDNPTWADAINVCNDMMVQFGDEDGIYLEGLQHCDPDNLGRLEFIIGS